MPVTFTTTPLATPPASALVVPDRWAANPALAAVPSATVATLVATASAAVEQHCHRRFALTAYREYLSGAGWPGQTLILPQTPVASIDRICDRAVAALTITAASLLARVGTTIAIDGTAGGVTLTSLATPRTTVTAATLAALATAINGTPGWSATVTFGFEPYPVAELRPLQGPVAAVGRPAQLAVYVESDPVRFQSPSGEPYRLDAEAGLVYGHFLAGQSNLRVDYTAGFATIPEPVQEAVVRVAQIAWQAANRNANVTDEQLGPYRTSYSATVPSAMADPLVRGWLAPYVSHSNLLR